MNLKVAIASSASQKEILENLRQLDINPKELDHIISGSDDLRHIHDPEGVNKPKPYIYQRCAQALNVPPKLCLVFEDSHAGVVAADRAGMNVIAIPNRYTMHQDFSMAKKIVTFNEIDLFAIQALV
uniref:Phosphorylated carbohydrates phosphatase n=1 Tax=Candidatus Berkiella aquae TaxID=295108 RepID=A0A0Q9Y9B4_9GAMM